MPITLISAQKKREGEKHWRIVILTDLKIITTSPKLRAGEGEALCSWDLK